MSTIFDWPIRVYYEDTDLGGIVYYANYLKYIERARSEMVRYWGIDQVEMKAQGVVFVVTHVEADYKRPAKYDDELIVRTSVSGVTPARFTMSQQVLRDDKLLFEAVVTVACMGANGRPVPVPQIVKDHAPIS